MEAMGSSSQKKEDLGERRCLSNPMDNLVFQKDPTIHQDKAFYI